MIKSGGNKQMGRTKKHLKRRGKHRLIKYILSPNELQILMNKYSVKIKGLKKMKKKGEAVSKLVKKYWAQRYELFSKYDEGIEMDEEGWFSVTPEAVAVRQARRCSGGLIIDAFTGVAGNAIQFATMCHHVIAIDIDPKRVSLALNNATVYGVENYIDYVVGDFFQLAPTLKADKVFLSPPWGGPSYVKEENFTLDLLKPCDGYKLFQAAQSIASNIIMFLPKNIDLQQVEELSWLSSPPLDMEIEEHIFHGKSKALTAYFGDVAYSQ